MKIVQAPTLALIAFGFVACSQPTEPTQPPPATPIPIAISVQGTPPAAGASSQFRAIATNSDGSTFEVPNDAVVWSTSDASVATVSPAGLVFGVTGGAAEIRAEYRHFSDRLGILVPGRGTYFAFVSDPGDPIGLGTVGVIRNAAFTIDYNWFIADGRGEHLQIKSIGPGQTLLMELHLQPRPHVWTGSWIGAQTFPFQGATVPGIKLMLHNRTCAVQTGQFGLHDIFNWGEFRISGIHLTFETHCDGALPGLRGELSVGR